VIVLIRPSPMCLAPVLFNSWNAAWMRLDSYKCAIEIDPFEQATDLT